MLEQKNSTALQYLQTFFKRKAIFFISLLLVPLIVFNISNFLPKYYAANALIKINDERILNPLISDLAVSSNFQQRLRTIEEEILTWENLASIIRGLSIEREINSQIQYEQLIFSMRKNINVQMVSQDLIRITYLGENPSEVKTVVDRITDLFIRKNILSQNQEADTATQFITEQLKVYQEKLDESERIVTLYRLASNLEKARQERRLILQQMELQPREIISRREQQENPLVAEFKMKLIELEVELSNLAVDSTENHPRVIGINSEKEKIKAQLQDAIKNPQSFETRTPNPLYQESEQKLKDVDFKIEEMEKELASIKALNEDYEPKVLPEQELASLTRDNRVNEHIYETLLARLETANITKRLEDSKSKTSFEVIEKARLPVKPVSPNIVKVIIYGILLGILVGIGLIMLMEVLDNSFRGVSDAKEFLGKPIIGAISTILTTSDSRKKMLKSKLLSFFILILAFSLASLGAYFYMHFSSNFMTKF